MRPGALDKIVSIVGDADVDEEHGGQEGDVETIVADEPAAIAPIAAAERTRGGVQAAEATHRITLWYRPEVAVTHRVVYADPYAGRTRTFEIVTVTNVGERGVELELEAIERVT